MTSHQQHLEPDRDQLEVFVDCLFRYRGNDGYLSLRSFTHGDQLLKPIITARLPHDDFKHIVDYAMDGARRAANNPEAAVFCPPVGVFDGKSGWQAREQDLLRGLVISVECDEHPDEAMQQLEEILGEATVVVRSGGQWTNGDGRPEDKLHLHWRLATPAEGDKLKDLKEARKLATAIAGGDPSNIPNVHWLRWAGSWHRKAAPRLCGIVRYNADCEIDLDAALAALREAAPPIAAAPASSGNGADGGRENWSELVGNLIAGGQLHRSITVLAAKMVATHADDGAIVNQIRGMMQNSRAKVDRPKVWQERYDCIPRAVSTAREKFGKPGADPSTSPPPPPPTDASEVHDDTPPPPDNVTDIRPKLKRKGASEAAAPQPQPQPGTHKPLIPLRPGHLPETLDAAAGALLAAGYPVLALDTVLVCPLRKTRPASDGREVETTRLILIAPAQMQRWLAEAATFTKYDKRSNGYVPCDPPLALATALLNTPVSWGFPSVIGLSSCPVMRADGTICTANGCDAATQLYLALDPALVMPDIPENPTPEQTKAALDLLLSLLNEFKFEGDTDKAVAVAWLMVPALRPAMRVAPMILFRANVSGSGKSYLVDLGAALASGQDAAAVVGAGPNNEETEKRLSSLLLEGVTHIAVDNVDFDIPGTSIWCHVSERPRLRVRILGMSKTPHIENAAYITVTGNNVQAKDDLIRRVLTCTMNVPIEQPEKRKFTKNPVRMVLADRGKYLAAIFTIAKHYRAAGSPDLGDDMWESYTEFVRLVRNPLRHLDPKLDPVRSVDTARAEDPTTVAIRGLFDHWERLWPAPKPDLLKDVDPTSREKAEPPSIGALEVYEKATEREVESEKLLHPEFLDLLRRVCAGRNGRVSSRGIDAWLKKIKGRVVEKKRLVLDVEASARRGPRYRLESVPAA